MKVARILHVTECYAGGVRKAITAIAQNLPDLDHHLLWSGDDTPENDLGFKSTTAFRRGFLSRVRQVRQEVRRLKPDVLHLHSSWAGAYGRIWAQHVPVVYEPHAYILSRPTLSPVERFAYSAAESYFARHTDMVIALSEDEVRIAKALSISTPVTRVTNVASVRPNSPVERSFPGLYAPLNIAMAGRISPQKDPDFFLRMVELVSQQRPNSRFTWIGDGNADGRKQLVDAGVCVTGWLEPKDVARELRETTLYFHSASYEGFPLSVLDAAAFSLPILVRNIPAFRDVGLLSVTSPEESAARIAQAISDPAVWRDLLERSAELDRRMSVDVQIAEMNALYSELSQ